MSEVYPPTSPHTVNDVVELDRLYPLYGPGRKEYSEVLESRLGETASALAEARTRLVEAHDTLDYFQPMIETLQKELLIDELTQAKNRKGLIDWGDKIYDKKMLDSLNDPELAPYRACIVVFDISGFGLVNNYISHRDGDKILQTVNDTFVSSVRAESYNRGLKTSSGIEEDSPEQSYRVDEKMKNRRSEDYVFGRIGGDEFMLVLDLENIPVGVDANDADLIKYVNETIVDRIKEDFAWVVDPDIERIRETMSELGKVEEFNNANPLALHHKVILNQPEEYFTDFMDRAIAEITRDMKEA